MFKPVVLVERQKQLQCKTLQVLVRNILVYVGHLNQSTNIILQVFMAKSKIKYQHVKRSVNPFQTL